MAGRKLILIVNGKPRAGKDTFAEILNNFVSVYKYSAVEKVKCIALDCGWTGKKEEKDRKFLSDLKMLTSAYSDMSYNDVMDRIEKFDSGEIKEDVMVIDVREPEEIDRLANGTGALTIFIKNDRVPAITSNEADANVENYDYDFIIDNNGTLQDFEETVEAFLDFLIAMSDMMNYDADDDEEDEE